MGTKREIINFWMIKFYENGIIRDYTMFKKDARNLFEQLKTDKGIKFETVLAGINIYRYTRNTKKPIIQFDKLQLDSLLMSYQQLQEVQKKIKTKKHKSKSKEHRCNTCLISFSSQKDVNNHQNTDKKHYFKQLYFSNSNVLENASRDIFIEINKGSGWIREVLPLNSAMKTTSHILIRNTTRNIYRLDGITEINSYIESVAIVTKYLPIFLMPNAEVILEIVACIPEALTTLFVNVFSFTNTTNNSQLHLIKEIALQVTNETYKDLLPTSQYKKQVAKRNNINIRKCVKVGVPTPIFNYVIDLEKYSVPKSLENLLAHDLQLFDGITKGEHKYLEKIQGTLKINESGHYLNRNNYFHLLDLLIHMEEYQLSIDIRNYDTETKDLIKVKGYNDRFQLAVPELAERRPSLLPGDSVFVKGADTNTFQGVVRMISQDTVILEFNKQFSRSVYMSGINLDVT
ncbi:hypothetical protein AMK59_8135, partial [Oryctes borbonicus]